MHSIVHNPSEGIYPATPDYVHALEVRDVERMLFVSGTMGLDSTAAPPVSLDAQLELAWSNIRAILASARMSLDHIVRATSYLQHADYAAANAAARMAALGGRLIPTTAIVVDTLSPDWLIELEVIAVG